MSEWNTISIPSACTGAASWTGPGSKAAYIVYHWRHETIANPYREMLSPAFRLLASRWVRRAPWKRREVAPKSELVCLTRLHFLRQYLRERRRPRKYAKLGLVKQAG